MERTDDNFIMLPTVDFCFKELMQNPKVRKGFIAALLKIRPEEIKNTILMPTILRQEAKDDKLGGLDVRVILEDDTQLDMEMQIAYFEYWTKRVLFYLSKIYIDQIHQGDSYEQLQKCIHVSILDFVHIPQDKECYHTIHLRDDQTGNIYTDLFELQILELPKLSSNIKSGEDIIKWMRFFSGKSREEFVQMAKENEYIEEAYNTLVKLSADEEKRLEYEAREKALKDYNTQMDSAWKRGIRRGEEFGRKQGIALAKQVLQLDREGNSPEEIASICQISISDVNEILE